MNKMKKQPKILIVDTQPYNTMVQSRALDSYFHKFKNENLMQIFSDPRTPCKGHCSILYQITDKQLFLRRFGKKNKVGRVFNISDLKAEWHSSDIQKVYRPKNKTPLYRFIRKLVWKKRYWLTKELDTIVDSFQPDFVFVGFSKDFFIFEIAMHFSEKYNIPLILSIADDYVFYDEYKGQFLNRLYRKKYLQTVASLFKSDTICIFESQKIKNKYQEHFNVRGEVIHIASDFKPVICTGFDLKNDWFYFGNLEFGRFNSLFQIADTLRLLGSNIMVHVYSKDIDKKKCKINHPNLRLHHQIPYSKAIEISKNAGALIIAEGFDEKDVGMVEYSLSTKVGDLLCSGRPIIAYGDMRCGSIGFLIENDVGYVATSKEQLAVMIRDLLVRKESHEIYARQFEVAKRYFDVEIQAARFLDFVMK